MTKPINRAVPPVAHGFDDLHFDYPAAVVLPRSGVLANIVGGGSDGIIGVSAYVAGGREVQGAPVIARLTANVAQQGTRHMAASQLAELLDYHGSWRGATVSDFYSEHTLYSLSAGFGPTIPLLAGWLSEATFAEQDFRRLQQQAMINAAVNSRQVRQVAMRCVKHLYWGDGHPLSMSGTPEQIASIERDELVRYYEQYYVAENMRVVFAGDVTDEDVEQADEILSSTLRHGEAVERGHYERHSTFTREEISVPGAKQAAIVMRLPVVARRHPDYLGLRILVMALGGYFGSRLMSNIRERHGYTYGIVAYLAGRHDDGHVDIVTDCKLDAVDHVIELIHEEIALLCDKPFPRDELEIVKQHIFSELARTLDTPFTTASHVAADWLYGIYPEYFNAQVAALNAATPKSLQQLALRYLAGREWITVVAR